MSTNSVVEPLDDRLKELAVMAIALADFELHHQALTIDPQMNLAGQSPTASSNGLFLCALFWHQFVTASPGTIDMDANGSTINMVELPIK